MYQDFPAPLAPERPRKKINTHHVLGYGAVAVFMFVTGAVAGANTTPEPRIETISKTVQTVPFSCVEAVEAAQKLESAFESKSIIFGQMLASAMNDDSAGIDAQTFALEDVNDQIFPLQDTLESTAPKCLNASK